MSELMELGLAAFGEKPLLVDQYSKLAHLSAQYNFADPKRGLSEWLREELDEVMLEGVGDEMLRITCLLPLEIANAGLSRYVDKYQPNVGQYVSKVEDTQSDIAKEFGDILWFINELAYFYGVSFEEIADMAVARNTDSDTQAPKNLSELQELAVANKDSFFVENKKFLFDIKLLDNKNINQEEIKKLDRLTETRISDNPLVVYNRLKSRLLKSSQVYTDISGPASSSDFDPDFSFEESAADMLWCMALIGEDRLGYGLNDYARLNLRKIYRRIRSNTVLRGDDIERSKNR